MSVPVATPSTSMSTLPLWIIAAAISAVAIRYTVFPPCCTDKLTTIATTAPKVMMLKDSIVPIPDGTTTLRVVVPPEGLLLRRP